MKKIIVIVLFLTLISTVQAENINVSPNTITVNLIGGDTITENVFVEYTGSGIVELNILTKIYPDGNGITVTYSIDSPFTIKPGELIIIEMTINTSMLLIPIQYNITTQFIRIEGEEEQPSGNGGISRLAYPAWWQPVQEEEKIKGDKGGYELPQEPDGEDKEPLVIYGTVPKTGLIIKIFAIIGILGIIMLTFLILSKRKKEDKE